MNERQHIDNHYGYGGLMSRIKAGLRKQGKDLNNLNVDDLA